MLRFSVIAVCLCITTTATAAAPAVGNMTSAQAGSLAWPYEIDVSVPTHSEGDLLVCIATWFQARDIAETPTGWTLIDTDQLNSEWAAWYRVAGASEPAEYTWKLTAGGAYGFLMVQITGAENPATTAIVSETATTGSGGTATCPDVTPAADESLVIRAFGWDTTDATAVTIPGDTTAFGTQLNTNVRLFNAWEESDISPTPGTANYTYSALCQVW